VESIDPYEHTEYGSNDSDGQSTADLHAFSRRTVITTADVNGDNLTISMPEVLSKVRGNFSFREKMAISSLSAF
jgi:hypothetical protein